MSIDVTSLTVPDSMTVGGYSPDEMMDVGPMPTQTLQSVPDIVLSGDFIFYNGEWIKKFNNRLEIPINYSGKVAILTTSLTEHQKETGLVSKVEPSSPAQQQALIPVWVVAIIIAIFVTVIVGTLWYSMGLTSKATGSDDTYVCEENATCYYTKPNGDTDPAGNGTTSFGTILKYAGIGIVLIGVGFIGVKAYQAYKKGTPVSEVARGAGRTVAAPFKGAYEVLKPAPARKEK